MERAAGQPGYVDARPAVPIGDRLSVVLVSIAVAGLASGGLLWWLGLGAAAGYVWTAATLPILVSLAVEIVVSLRRADVGLDIIAALSMSAALVFAEPLAANVVALMYAGGQMLERYAEGQARREMTSLLGRVARTAMRRRGAELDEVPIEAIRPGDTILVRQGEVLPVDGVIASGAEASLDLSALTGESLPQNFAAGAEALSGSTSLGAPFDLIASHEAANSAYAAIVRRRLGNLGARILFEPGRLFVGNAGILVSEVVYLKEGAAKNFLVVDAAMNDLIRPTLYEAHHDIRPVRQPKPGTPTMVADVVGGICETGDYLALDRPLPPLSPGDLIAIMTAGAYGAVQASTYNTRPLLPEVMVKGAEWAVVRPRQTYDELIGMDRTAPWLAKT